MRVAIRFLLGALLAVPAFAADHPDFRLWKADELKKRDAALSKKVGPDHSARETLADFGDHRFRFLYRNADGFPEQHDNIVDVVFVQSGQGVLQLGGTMVDKKATGGAGEFVRIEARRWRTAPARCGRYRSYSGHDPTRLSRPEGGQSPMCC